MIQLLELDKTTTESGRVRIMVMEAYNAEILDSVSKLLFFDCRKFAFLVNKP
jgi:hypothetical protein